MATATMGLRRRVPVNNSPIPSTQSSPSTSNKRSRSENNNNPSHGNLNSLNVGQNEPPAKKSRGTSTNGSKSSSTSAMDSSLGQCSTKGRATSAKSSSHTKGTATSTSATAAETTSKGSNVLSASSSWSATSAVSDGSPYGSVAGLNVTGGQSGMCSGSLSMSTTIPYMAPSIATFVGNATNLGKSTSVSYLDISNMTGGAMNSTAGNGLNSTFVGTNKAGSSLETKNNVALPFSGAAPTTGSIFGVKSAGQTIEGVVAGAAGAPKKFQNNAMFNAYQPWVIKTYGDLAKTKTITIKKYARILRTLRGEEVNSAENSKFRFWVKSKGFYIGQPDGYDAKPADRIVGRHAVTNPGLDPPLYVPTQLPHNKALNGAEGTVPPGRVYKKVAIVENFFDIIHAVHVDLEGRPGKHAGQKRTYRTITETYAFLPREAVTRFLLGCTECQRRPRTPSPTNLSNQLQANVTSPVTPLSPTPGTALSAPTVQNSPKPREASHAPESKSLYNYRHPKHQKTSSGTTEKVEKEREEKYNPLSITNLLKKEPATNFPSNSDNLTESRRTPESDRASSRSSASSKRRRMLPEGRTPSPQPSLPLPRPWSPGIDPKSTAIDYSLPITTSYLKHQQRILAEKNKASSQKNVEIERNVSDGPDADAIDGDRFSPAAGLIDTNLNLLATIQHLHCQVMLALTERLRPSIVPMSLALPTTSAVLPNVLMSSELSLSATGLGENNS